MTLVRQRVLRLVLPAAAIAALIVAVWRPEPGDYSDTLGGNPNNSGAAISALAHGHFDRLPEDQPLMGAASLILRAPLAAIGDALGGIQLEYWLGAFGCLTTLAVLALALGAEARRQRRTILGAAVVVGLVLLNTATVQSISAGHPEELLLAATATGGVWATARGRAGWGGALTGTAIGTLPFGLAGLIAAATATRTRRSTLLATAALVGLLFVIPLPSTAPQTYLDRSRDLSHLQRVYQQSVWWWAGHDRLLLVDTGEGRVERTTIRVLPSGLDRGAGLLAAAAVALAVTLLAPRRNGDRALGYDALALLSLLFLLRSGFDPQNLEYYVAPALVALVAWEVLARNRLPLVAAVAIGADAVVFHRVNGHGALPAVAYTVWFIGLGGYLVAAIRGSAEVPAPRSADQYRRNAMTWS